MQGHLKQKSGFFSNYHQFYYKLEDTALLRFKHSKDAKAVETFDLSDGKVNAISEADGLTGKPHSIAIFLTGKSPLLLVRAKQLTKLMHTLDCTIRN
jgi:hypothetical protein